MTLKNRLGLWAICCAIVIGCAGDWLLRGTPWGINIPILVAGAISCVIFPSIVGWTRRRRTVYVALFASLVFSLGLAWRASPVLGTLNVLCALLCLSLATRPDAAGHPGSLTRQVMSHLRSSAYSIAGPVPVAVSEVSWDVAQRGWHKRAFAVLRGVIIAVPILLVFGALLVAADAVFENLVTGIFDFDAGLVIGHAALVVTLAWVFCGFLYAVLFEKDWPESVRVEASRPRWLSLGAVESGIVLGSLNVLFLAFVAVQAGYLFGGAGGAGMNFSEYARRGFFELVAVVALVVPLLLLLDWLYGDGTGERRRGRTVLDVLIIVTVLLVGVILASALWRMSLYYREFGLTELRLYTTVFMGWIGLVLLALLVTLPRRQRSAFGSVSFYSALLTVVALNILNPDATIAQVNLDRREEGKRFDGAYLTSLSEDAAPVIAPALPDIGDEPVYKDISSSEAGIETVEDTVERRWTASDKGDWRSWNTARATARQLVTTDTST